MSRVVWFHPRPWGPPQGGGDLRTWGLIRGAVSRGHEVLLVVPEGKVVLQPPAGVTVLSFTQPRPARLAAAKVFSRHPLRSPRLGPGERRRVAAETARFSPEVAVVSEVMAWSVASAFVGSLPVVADCANLEGALFRELLAGASGSVDRLTFGIDARRVRLEERRLLARSTAVIAVSETDAEALRPMAGTAPVSVVPSSVPDPGVATAPHLAGPVALFVGTLDYLPNVDAVTELVEHILPEIRGRVPAARLVVAGRRPMDGLRRLVARHEWVELVEDAPDLAPLYSSARCVVLPIRSGGGTKLKVYEALSYGVPVVATREAVAGIPLSPDSEMLLGTTSGELAAAALSVMTDDSLAQRLAGAARTAYTERLSWESGAVDRLDSVIRMAASGDQVSPDA